MMRAQENAFHGISIVRLDCTCTFLTLLSLRDRVINGYSEEAITLEETPKQTGLYRRNNVSQFRLFRTSLSNTGKTSLFRSSSVNLLSSEGTKLVTF